MAVLVREAKSLRVDFTFRVSDSQGSPKLLRGVDIQAQLKSTTRLQGEGSRNSGDEVEYI